MWKWLEKLFDPLIQHVTQMFAKEETGQDMSKEDYEHVKDTGLNYLETGTTGDEKLDDYMDEHTPPGAKPVIDLVNGIEDSSNWVKDQVESLTGDKTNEVNQEIAEENLGFEKEKFEYDKALQQQMFEREDTAYQRTVNDMRMAGMNPLNMQSTNGAGGVVATTAPQNNFQHQMTNQLGLMETVFNAALQAKTQQSNHSLQTAQSNLLNQQAESQRIKNIYEADILATQIAGLKYDNNNKWFERENNLRDMLFNQMMGWTRDMPDWLKQSSARMNYAPFNWKYQNTPEDFRNALGNPNAFYHNLLSNSFKFDKDEISSKLLSDELLTGSLGMFGNLIKMLVK